MSPVVDEGKACRLKSKAEACFLESDLETALSHAKRASSLCSSLDGVRSMLTSLKILAGAKNQGEGSAFIDYYKALLIEPFSSANSVKRQYKKLALDIHPDRSDFSGCEEAFKLIGEAYKVLSDETSKEQYDLKLRVTLQDSVSLSHFDRDVDSFRTFCESCLSQHQFERRYLGHSLVCPNCKMIFTATEIGDENRVFRSERLRKKAASRSKIAIKRKNDSDDDESIESMTLAEFKSQIKQKTKKEPEDTASNILVYKRRTKPSTQNVVVYDFNEERTEKSFKKGQIWALYDNYKDRMPRLYALIEDVSMNPFQAKVSWLYNEKTYCGRFRISSQMIMNSIDEFSHVIKCEKAAREAYRVYPWKGSVWALFKDSNSVDEYDFVVFLTSYCEPYGASFAYLERISGVGTVFKRQSVGSNAIRVVVEEDLAMVSHPVLARKLPETDCWELDPASLPSR